MQRIGELELDHDPGFERRQWQIQRASWLVLMLLLAAAVAGLFGSGWLSSAEVTSTDESLVVAYERFVRREVDHEMTVSVAVGEQRNGQVEIWMDVASLNTVVVDTISPEPVEERVERDRQVFVFAVGDVERLDVRFVMAQEDIGRSRVRVGVEGGSEVSYTQLSYP